MPVPHVSASFGDLVDRRVTKIFYETYDQLPDYIPKLFNVQSSSDQYETVSGVGGFQDFSPFTGTVTYQSQNQGYDVRATHVEFASGFQIERALYDDDRHNLWQGKPRNLATAAQRTRQKHGARALNNAFSIDTMFYNHSEGVALCSNSHTTTYGNVSTATGFDNLTTASLYLTSLIAAKKQMMQFLDEAGNKISLMPDELWIPVDLLDVADEIVNSSGKPDTANNNINVMKGSLTIQPSANGWNYLNDTNNWFICDGSMRKENLVWLDRVALEFAQAEDIDTLVAKWRAYMRYSQYWYDWRWILGAQVS